MYGVIHVAEAYAAVELVGYDRGDVKADRPQSRTMKQRTPSCMLCCFDFTAVYPILEI